VSEPGHTRARLLAMLAEYQARHGRMPTIKELCAQLNVGRGRLQIHLRALQSDGKLIIHPRGTLPVTLR